MILTIIEVFYKLFILYILIEKCGTAHRLFFDCARLRKVVINLVEVKQKFNYTIKTQQCESQIDLSSGE